MPPKGSKRLTKTGSLKGATVPQPPPPPPPVAEVNSSSEKGSKPFNVHVPGTEGHLQQEKPKKLKQRQQEERVASPVDTFEWETTQDDRKAASQALQTSQSRKAKSRAVLLAPEQEQDVADWYKGSEWLYNFRCEAYKDMVRKDKALEDKAAELGYTAKRTSCHSQNCRTLNKGDCKSALTPRTSVLCSQMNKTSVLCLRCAHCLRTLFATSVLSAYTVRSHYAVSELPAWLDVCTLKCHPYYVRDIRTLTVLHPRYPLQSAGNLGKFFHLQLHPY